MESTNNSVIYPYDWAICILEAPLGNYVGSYFGAQSYGVNSQLDNVPIKLTGYPADTSYGYTSGGLYQYETGEKITSVANDTFQFSAYTAGGFSGGPIRRTSDNYIVGINQGKTLLGTPIGVRISQEMIDIMKDNR